MDTILFLVAFMGAVILIYWLWGLLWDRPFR
jgi:hypothetical protein